VPPNAEVAIGYPAAGRMDLMFDGRLRPSIHMPRWASRLTLTVTEVRVQRLQEISEEDARDEGAGLLLHEHEYWDGDPDCYRKLFRVLWTAIHGPAAWDANPEVVALSFTVERRNIDAAEGA
jgi:uncharacterized protein YhfF